MAADINLTDQNLAQAIKTAAANLNDLTDRAIGAGLTVEMDIAHHHPCGGPQRDHVVVKIRREL